MAKELHLQFYDQIGSDFWSGEGTTAKAISKQLTDNPEASEIILHINSPGGSVYEGYTIYNLLKASGKKVTAKIEGYCASIATLIALSAEEIEMLPLAQWLIHNPFTSIDYADAEDLLQAAAELKRIEGVLVSVYVAKTGKTEDEIRALMQEDKFISAEEAVEMGFATRVLEPLKAVAIYNPPKTNQPNNVMTEEIQNSLADKIINGLKGLFQPKAEAEPVADPAPVAATETLEGGGTIYFEGDLTEGTLVYSDEAMTVLLADGEHALADGRILTVASGAVASITEPAPANDASEELTAANAKIAELEEKLAGIQNSLSEKDKTITALKAQARKALTPKPVQNFAGDAGAPKEEKPEVKAFHKAFKK